MLGRPRIGDALAVMHLDDEMGPLITLEYTCPSARQAAFLTKAFPAEPKRYEMLPDSDAPQAATKAETKADADGMRVIQLDESPVAFEAPQAFAIPETVIIPEAVTIADPVTAEEPVADVTFEPETIAEPVAEVTFEPVADVTPEPAPEPAGTPPHRPCPHYLNGRFPARALPQFMRRRASGTF